VVIATADARHRDALASSGREYNYYARVDDFGSKFGSFQYFLIKK
jgi:hypothetical protein